MIHPKRLLRFAGTNAFFRKKEIRKKEKGERMKELVSFLIPFSFLLFLFLLPPFSL